MTKVTPLRGRRQRAGPPPSCAALISLSAVDDNWVAWPFLLVFAAMAALAIKGFVATTAARHP